MHTNLFLLFNTRMYFPENLQRFQLLPWSLTVWKNSYVKKSLAVSLISQTLPLVLLYVKSIVGGQQGRSKMCFVSCLKPWGTEQHKLPPLWQWIEKNKFVSFLTNILSLKIWDTKTKSAATSSHCLSVRIISSLGETLASGLIHTAGEGWPAQG